MRIPDNSLTRESCLEVNLFPTSYKLSDGSLRKVGKFLYAFRQKLFFAGTQTLYLSKWRWGIAQTMQIG